MTYLKKAHKLTDKEIARMEKNIRAIYSRAADEMKEKMLKASEAFEKQDKIKKLQVAAGSLKQEDYIAWRERTLLNNSRYTKMTEQLTQTLLNADKLATAYTNNQMAGIYALNLNALNMTVKSAVKGYSFELVDANVVKNLLRDNLNLLPLKTVNEKKVVRWIGTKINQELTQGILQGEAIPKIADRLQKVTGMESRYAVTNARTMCTSAENKGRFDGMLDAEEKGVVMMKQWSAVNDKRTRDWHSDLDGEQVDLDEAFENEYGEIMYPGDPNAEPANVYNCRCSLETHIIGFKGENGFYRV